MLKIIILLIFVVILNLIRLSHAKVRRIFGIVKFIWHFNKNSSTAVPLRNERYKHFLISANAGTKFIKILKIIFLDYYPSRNFSEKIDTFLRKLTKTKRSSEQKRSVTSVTNVTHLRVRSHQLCFFRPLLPTFDHLTTNFSVFYMPFFHVF